jgi:hypothetical protein
MAYSHFVSYLPDSYEVRSAWPRLRDDAASIIERFERDAYPLAGPDADGRPLLTDTVIAFNGAAPHAGSALYLTLQSAPAGQTVLEIGTDQAWWNWTFVRTSRYPYDPAVCAVLLRAHVLAPRHVAIGSDGTWTDWLTGRQLYAELFGIYSGPDPLTDTLNGPPAAWPTGT